MTEDFWKDKKVCVTGGAGFLGSFVVDKLEARGAKDVFVPRSKEYDLTKIENVERMLDDADPDIILHIAALAGGIGANRDRPAEFFYNNLMMGVPLMHAAYERWEAEGKVDEKKFVALGTVCSYPKFAKVPFKEEDLWTGYPEETNAPYGLAKAMLMVQAQTYREQYGFNAIYLLPVNLYGPRDNFNLQTSHVIPALIRKFLEAQERGDTRVQLWGDGSPTREFLYVEDAAEGILLATEGYNESDPVNLGSGLDISIKDLAELIGRLTEFEGTLAWGTEEMNGQPRRMLDVRRAKERFGFEAQMMFEEGLKRTIEWFRENKETIA